MAKILVVKREEGEGVPFLRGILTHSLQDAGLPFDDAYDVAAKVRAELKDSAEVTNERLREMVVARLRAEHPEFVDRYVALRSPVPTILLRIGDGVTRPLSRGRQRLRLESCGLSGEEATQVAADIYNRLAQQAVTVIGEEDLDRLTYERIRKDLSKDAAHRFLVWKEFQRSDRPLILLLGGVAGTGKSTVATKLAHLLDIIRAQSTDMLREVMRTMVPKRLLPALHTSSFKVWEVLPGRQAEQAPTDALLAEGYLTQAELVGAACEAVIQRALKERVSLILEGVHIHPSMTATIAQDTDAIVVPVMLAVLKPKHLRQRFLGRGKRQPGRRAKRYLEHFDEIWRIQSFLLSEADRLQVAIVVNDDMERAVSQVMATLFAALSQTFEGSPAEILK
ncbi:MAG: hypothetical protein ACYTG6_04205 [Planctomycetota bacterium]|jgi:2-phosphoglycerate kinase